MLVAADLQRPAAIEQLKVIGEQIGVPVYSEAPDRQHAGQGLPERIEGGQASRRYQRADSRHGRPVARRRRADGANWSRSTTSSSPHQILLVCDAMTGQDAVNSRQGLQRGLGTRRRDPHQARRRHPRRSGAAVQGGHRRADQVHRRRRSSSTGWSRSTPTAWPAAFWACGDMVTLCREGQRELMDERGDRRAAGKDARGEVHAGRLPKADEADQKLGRCATS